MMRNLTLADVVVGLTGTQIESSVAIHDVVIDSRQAKAGSLFVALKGEQTDGHNFVQQAFENGALAAITQQRVSHPHVIQARASNSAQIMSAIENLPFCIQVDDTLQGLQDLAAFWRNQFSPRVIGITGSVGKSTTKELTWAVLSTRFKTLKSEGNYNNEIGLPLSLLNLKADHAYIVLEMGMYDVGEIALLCDLAQPHVGVITNVGPVHLQRLGSIERIAEAKAELVQALPGADTLPVAERGIAILNYDDSRVRLMAAKTQARVFTYGLSAEADLWASDVSSNGLDGIRFVFHYQGESIHARIPLLGRHSVHTALRAALVGLVEGLAWEEIIAGLQSLPNSSQLRLVAEDGPNGAILLDDTYNASPASTIAALNLLDDLTATKKIAVLGDMMELGAFEEEGHRKVGCRAADTVDLLVVIGSRSKITADEAKTCGLDPTAIVSLENNQAAVAYLAENLKADDIVLIKGSLSQNMNEIVSALAVEAKKVKQRKAP